MIKLSLILIYGTEALKTIEQKVYFLLFSPGLNARCIETDGGTSKGACCVFPFIYHGVQYFECTEDQNKKPWCATTSNYDIDGMWGHCLGEF